jgi:CheY-like chemotaxis protein
VADQPDQLLAAERAARAAAEQALSEQRETLARLSHDLRTPVTAILMWVDVLRHHPAQLVRGLQAIERSARAQTEILERAVERILEPAASPAAPASAAPDLTGLKVLVVEDVADIRQLLVWLLEERRATAVPAASVEAALALLTSERPDVIVSDIEMPDNAGFSLIRTVRGLDARDGGQTPAVALITNARRDDRTQALLAGYQMHVEKPVDPGELIAAIAALSARRER